MHQVHLRTCLVYFFLLISLEPNKRYFADGIFRCIFVNEKFCILIRLSIEFVPKDPVKKNSICLDNGLVPNRRPAIIWTNAESIHGRIYAVPGGGGGGGALNNNISYIKKWMLFTSTNIKYLKGLLIADIEFKRVNLSSYHLWITISKNIPGILLHWLRLLKCINWNPSVD